MSFRPNVHDELIIDGVAYRIAEHPAAPGFPYGQEGRAGIVYCLQNPATASKAALKVFKPRFRTPALFSQAEKLAAFADLPGLTVCRRTVLTRAQNADLLRQHPDLIYAVLMPWIEGPTWTEVMLEKRPLTPQQALDLARALAEVLESMEVHGLAHCDLSGPNVLLPMLAGQTADRRPQTAYRPPSAVELVDVEGLYAPGLPRPEALPSGSSGYAHRTAREGLWGPTADRFAGAVLLAEMLGWCDPQVVQAAWGESYFDPQEMQQDTPRYRTLMAALERRWGSNVARLFERAWRSDSLLDCPTFGEWLVALPEHPVAQAFSLSTPAAEPAAGERTTSPHESAAVDATAEIRAFMQVARRFEEQHNYQAALEAYRQALELARADPSLRSLAREIEATIQEVEKRASFLATLPNLEEEMRVSDQASGRQTPAATDLQEKAPEVWKIWLGWVTLTTISVAIGYVLADYIIRTVPIYIRGEPVIRASYDIIVGTVLGVGQWLILRPYFRRAGWWILASSLGLCLNGIISGFMWEDVFKIQGWTSVSWDAFSELMSRTPVGFMQWLFLRQYTHRSGGWIILTPVSWAIGWILTGIWSYDKGWLAAGTVIGATVGVITGSVLVMIMPPRLQDS
jgi:tetratricopeptide (TPR) repeat protein